MVGGWLESKEGKANEAGSYGRGMGTPLGRCEGKNGREVYGVGWEGRERPRLEVGGRWRYGEGGGAHAPERKRTGREQKEERERKQETQDKEKEQRRKGGRGST